MILLGGGLGVVLLAGVLARVLEQRAALADGLFRWGMLAGCLAGVSVAIAFLLGPSPASSGSGLGAAFGLDPLSAWFLCLVLGVGAITAVYGVRYLALERRERPIGTAHLLFAVLVTAIAGVVTARTIVAFMAAWEVMTISAYLLVVFDHRQTEIRRAGMIYLVVTHLSTIALLGMFALWGGGLTASFAELAATAARPGLSVSLVLLLALIGFGIKAGVVPGHFWLPGAHAATPSHVSALMSGVLIKTGVYGLLRVLALLGPPPAWWAWLVLLLGLASAVLGVLWALAQHDLKRLLAYHSVENIGIILIGLGLGALGVTYHHPVVAALGFAGALLHTLNHALFKSLLFLGAGAVYRATGTRRIDSLGGVFRIMPGTAWAFLIGSMAIVGLPPLNGFVSEWVMFRGLFETAGATGVLRTASIAATGLALAGALALVCFTKIYGVIFLGSPRSALELHPEFTRGLLAPQAVLAALCIVIGFAPALVVPVALRVVATLRHGVVTPVPEPLAGLGAVSGMALGLVALVALLWWVRSSAARAPRTAATWACAYPATTARMQYTASSYAAGLLAFFGPLSGTRRELGADVLHVHPVDPVLDQLGRPVWQVVNGWALWLRRLQTGRIFWYLLYVITTLFGMLLYLWFVRS
jgi:hydrogenase-4 component B